MQTAEITRAAEALRAHDRRAGTERDWPVYLAEAERFAVALAALRPHPAPSVALTRPTTFRR